MRYTPDMRSLAVLSLLISCAPAPLPRMAEVVQALERADDVLLRTRPELMRGKYAQMAADPYSFYRGNLALFRNDWELGRASRSGFAANTLPVRGLGDPHPENFGVLLAGDGTPALEPNDFDSADLLPFLFDVRRLVCGLALAVTLQVGERPLATNVGTAAARQYAETLEGLVAGAAPVRVAGPGDSRVLEDLFSRSRRDLLARAELTDFTVLDGGSRFFKHGVIDPADPTESLAPVEATTRSDVSAALWRLGGAERFRVLDVVRIYGSGVSSWPRVRLLLLAQGETPSPADDLIIEVKELTESPLAGWYRPLPNAADTPSRIEGALRRAWARPDADPLWFTTDWLGMPIQVRTKSNAHRTLRISRLTGARATEPELVKLGQVLGALLARVHAQSDAAAVQSVVAQVSRDVATFASEQGAFGDACAQQVVEDHAHFTAALAELGPTLGVPADATPPPPLLRGPP